MVKLALLAAVLAATPARLDGLDKAALLARGARVAENFRGLGDDARRAKVRDALAREAAEVSRPLHAQDRAFLDEAVEKSSRRFDRGEAAPPPPTGPFGVYYVTIRGLTVAVYGYPAGPDIVWKFQDQAPEVQRLYNGF